MRHTKVPFDYEQFISGKVILYFDSKEEVEDFTTNLSEHWRGSPYHASGRERPSYYWRQSVKLALRFHDGQWVNRGNHATYNSVEYDYYTHMLYECGGATRQPPVEVGDLL